MLVVVEQGRRVGILWKTVSKGPSSEDSNATESSINSITWVLPLKVTADLCRKSVTAVGKGEAEGS